MIERKVRTNHYLYGMPARAVLALALTLAVAGLVVVAWSRPAYAATIAVTTTTDDATNNGNCTLREAIIAANTDAARDACPAGSGADTITVPAGTYTLTIPEVTPNAPRDATVGDLDITGPATINGAGARTTRVVGGAEPFNDRIFENFATTTTISGLTITGGHPRIGDARGGGVRNNANTLTLDKVAVSANTAVYHAGILGQGGTLNVTDSTVSGNSAFETGGGITQFDGTANITNSTISSNRADDPDDPSCCGVASGVAVQGAGSTMNIESSTIANNTSDSPGGGIATSRGATANVKNTIVANNATDNCDTIAYDGGPITSQGNNIDSTNDCRFAQPTDKPNTNPLIGALANNGGPTDTRALQPSSPAIDSGDSAAATDQRGVTRPQNGDNNGSAIDDVGAFELGAGTSISINDATATEGNSGTTNATFTAALSGPSNRSVTVDYATASGTASAGSDYASTSGRLTFAAGETSKTITVPVKGDTTDEPNETFVVNLSNATNATLSDAQGTGTITDDDETPPPPGNTAPAAQDDAYSVAKGKTFTAPRGVLANDSDPDGDALTARLVSGPGKGKLTLNSDGSFSYEPPKKFKGATFVYEASDGKGGADQAKVTLSQAK